MRALGVLVCVGALACSQAGRRSPPTGTRFVGVVETAGDSIVTSITFVNELDRERGVAFAPCPPRNTVKLTLTSAPAGAYRGVWDYATMDSLRQLRKDFQRPACVPLALRRSLPARTSVTSRFIAFRTTDVLGDSLPDGRYAVWLFPRIAGRDPAGIPAGEIELRRP